MTNFKKRVEDGPNFCGLSQNIWTLVRLAFDKESLWLKALSVLFMIFNRKVTQVHTQKFWIFFKGAKSTQKWLGLYKNVLHFLYQQCSCLRHGPVQILQQKFLWECLCFIIFKGIGILELLQIIVLPNKSSLSVYFFVEWS